MLSTPSRRRHRRGSDRDFAQFAGFLAGAPILHYHARDAKTARCAFDHDSTRACSRCASTRRPSCRCRPDGDSTTARDASALCPFSGPDMMSLNVGSKIHCRPYINRSYRAEYWAAKMQEYGVRPEIERFRIPATSKRGDAPRKIWLIK
ncbi:MAG: 3-keto-5-aminohexanoate cleavage protein [Gemmatimonadetes bacterium]|nr:3-keto-5-aminohexanoate cleavage protein [Gemmatimonadota bacterium]